MKMLIKELQKENRPRERALSMGISYTTDAELLAILFGTGTKNVSAVELGHLVLNEYTITELTDVTIEELQTIPGIGPAKALTILAAFELFRRLKHHRSEKVTSPSIVYQLCKNEMTHLNQEHFVVLYLNSQKELIQKRTVFVGSLNVSVVHPREVFKWAVKYSAASIILVHNHPSGDSTPSKQDINVTQALMESGTVMGIDVIDHIIIGKGNFHSLKEIGYMKGKIG